MKTILAVTLLWICFFSQQSIAQSPYVYPFAVKDSATSNYFDQEIADPYRYMENSEDARLKDWLDQQKSFTKKQERRFSRAEILNHARELNSIRRVDKFKTKTVDKPKKYKFEFRFDNLNSTANLYYKLQDGPFKLLFKSKNYQKHKHDNVVVRHFQTDPDEKIVLVEISHSGSDWTEIYVFDLQTGKQLPDHIRHTLNENIIWHGDGFFYALYDSVGEGEIQNMRRNQRLAYHKLGTSQKLDKVIFHNPDTTGSRTFHLISKENEKNIYLWHPLNIRNTWYDVLSFIPLQGHDNYLIKNFIAISESADASFKLLFEKGDSVFFLTNLNSPRRRVVIGDRSKMNHVSEFIPEYQEKLVDMNKLGDDKYACFYFKNGQYSVLVFDTQGKLLKTFQYPQGIKVSGFYADQGDKEAYYYLHSFYQPTIAYKINLETLESESTGRISINYRHDFFETTYVTCTSEDGTEVPMYLTHYKNIEMNGENPVLINAYGGYGTTMEPEFSWEHMMFILKGGILAVPNVRGGGAVDDEWAKAGRGVNKPNAVSDFIAASDFLIENNYTNPEKIAIEGGSHGGMLVAAAMVKKPQNFKAVVAFAGVYDMLRYHLFTAGAHSLNLKEFGVSINKEEFESLQKYSPIHNIKNKTKYPATLLITGDSDSRVVPLHSYKFLAHLQSEADPSSLYMMHVIPDTGHQESLTINDYIDVVSFKYGFIFDMLNMN